MDGEEEEEWQEDEQDEGKLVTACKFLLYH
jgi:hypothetical protein